MSRMKSKIKNGAKWLGLVASAATLTLLPALALRNRVIEHQFKSNMRSSGVTALNLLDASPEKRAFDAEEEAALVAMGCRLVYNCAPNIDEKAQAVTNDKGQPFLYEENGITHVWDAKKESYRALHVLYRTQDENGAQAANFYDPEEKMLLINLGGTDFANPSDLFAAAQAVSGGLAPRILSGEKIIHETLASLESNFGVTDPKQYTTTVTTHSTGIITYFGALPALAKNGIQPDRVYDVDGFGADRACSALCEAVTKTPQENLALYKSVVDGMVSFHAINEIDKYFVPLENIDPGNIIGKSETPGEAIGGTKVDFGTNPHKAIKFIPTFTRLAKQKM